MATPNNTQLLLESGILFYGTWTAPDTIGTDAIQPNQKFSGVKLGSIERGTQVWDLGSDYAEAWVGTPAELYRKDRIKNKFSIKGNLYEYNNTTLEIVMGLRTQAGYVVTNPSAQTHDLSHIGPRKNPITPYGFLLKTVDVFGRELEIAMFAGLITPTDQAVNQSGDKYAVISFMAEATSHVDFPDTLAAKLDSYGYIDIRQS